MPGGLPHAVGKKCGAKTRAGGVCKQPAMPNGRCRMHGGKSKQGVAHPQIKHGRYSKNLPARMQESYEASLKDTNLLDLRDGIAVLDARIADVMKRVDVGESLELWATLRERYRELREAERVGDEQGASEALQEMARIINRGYQDWRAWDGIERTLDNRRRHVETEARRVERMHQTMTAEQAALLVVAVQEIIFRHVPEDDRREKIADDIRALMNRTGASG